MTKFLKLKHGDIPTIAKICASADVVIEKKTCSLNESGHPVDFPVLINWKCRYPIWGVSGMRFHFYFISNRNSCKQTVETLIRHRNVWRLIWVCTVCLGSHEWVSYWRYVYFLRFSEWTNGPEFIWLHSPSWYQQGQRTVLLLRPVATGTPHRCKK